MSAGEIEGKGRRMGVNIGEVQEKLYISKSGVHQEGDKMRKGGIGKKVWLQER